MSELLSRFSVDAAKFNAQIGFFIALVWLVVIGCAISSIAGQQPFSKKQKVFWTVVVAALPVVGIILYLPFALRRENYPGLFNVKNKH